MKPGPGEFSPHFPAASRTRTLPRRSTGCVTRSASSCGSRWKVSRGQILHSELTYGDGVIMVSQERHEAQDRPWKLHDAQPEVARRRVHADASCSTWTMRTRIARTPARGARPSSTSPRRTTTARATGADRSYGATDLEGHMWWITQRLRESAVKDNEPHCARRSRLRPCAALADSTRRAVIRELLRTPLRAGELAERVEMSAPALSTPPACAARSGPDCRGRRGARWRASACTKWTSRRSHPCATGSMKWKSTGTSN